MKRRSFLGGVTAAVSAAWSTAVAAGTRQAPRTSR